MTIVRKLEPKRKLRIAVLYRLIDLANRTDAKAARVNYLISITGSIICLPLRLFKTLDKLVDRFYDLLFYLEQKAKKPVKYLHDFVNDLRIVTTSWSTVLILFLTKEMCRK